jgi:group II intron reverse transcriptase/maturase
MTFEQIESSGTAALLDELHNALKNKTYRPGPVRRVNIPKPDGGERPLGIPNIRDRVVQAAVKLILEPIFEADFDDASFGFRPRRGAHQALDAIGEAFDQGMCWLIDADITAYFDTIPHDRLMKAVAERVVDGSMLALIKMFLEAPIVESDGDNRPRRNRKGTPQGGVVSPLLANLYLHLLDRNFRKHVGAGALEGRLVRYADDFVLLTRRIPDRELAWLTAFLARLGLSLHPEKTRVTHASDGFAFLGYAIRWRSGRMWLDMSRKARSRVHDQLRQRTRWTSLSLEEQIDVLNKYIRGAKGYFGRIRQRTKAKLDHFVAQRMARWWARKHNAPRPAWSLVEKDALWREHKLERWWALRVIKPAAPRPVR